MICLRSLCVLLTVNLICNTVSESNETKTSAINEAAEDIRKSFVKGYNDAYAVFLRKVKEMQENLTEIKTNIAKEVGELLRKGDIELIKELEKKRNELENILSNLHNKTKHD